jgi:Flp pilus assembly pilin Flp
MRMWRFLHRDGRGQALIEYSLIMALIVVIVLVVLIVMGNTVKNLYCNVAAAVVQ